MTEVGAASNHDGALHSTSRFSPSPAHSHSAHVPDRRAEASLVATTIVNTDSGNDRTSLDALEESNSIQSHDQDGNDAQNDLCPRHLHAPVTAVNLLSPTFTPTSHDSDRTSTRPRDHNDIAFATHELDTSWERSDLVTTIFGSDDLPRLLFAWYDIDTFHLAHSLIQSPQLHERSQSIPASPRS